MRTITHEQIEVLNRIFEKADFYNRRLADLSTSACAVLRIDPDCPGMDTGIARAIVDDRLPVDEAVADIINEWAMTDANNELIEIGNENV
jgi:spore coat polysaccharide biosynthesis protein SpsF (cytidylyltransferase family)